MRLTITCGWRSAGWVQLIDADLVMPALPQEAGVYQWVFRHAGRERRYVGEASLLRRRFAHYRRPGPSQTTNARMRERALRVLGDGGTIELLLATDIRLERDGHPVEVDLTSKHVRCLVENAALVDVLHEVGEIVNDKGYGEHRADPILG